jgi:hypothetical protein
LGAPIGVEDLFVKRGSSEVGDANEREEDSDECDRRGRCSEVSRSRLPKVSLLHMPLISGSTHKLHRATEDQDDALVGDEFWVLQEKTRQRNVEQRQAADHGARRDDSHVCCNDTVAEKL